MKYGIITDIHNNVTALRAVLKRLDEMNCDRIICCGDMVGIGPDPEETVQEMIRIPGLIAVRGNHEDYLLEGIPTEWPNEENMSYGEMEHHKWEHGLLSEESVAFLRGLPKRIDFIIGGFSISVMHSCMDENGRYSKSKTNPTESDLMDMFADVESDIIIYGHDHNRNICKGDKFYINVGSLGCPSKEHDIARAGVLSIENGIASIEKVDVRYDVDAVIRKIDELNYPDAENIKRYFYGF
ncbi:MAG: metallophosphoesterase family protein [Erysipelotrichaceae bacterium]|nr:metallophosphoesterase family protein [Erysipelotrichaceae bacterium]